MAEDDDARRAAQLLTLPVFGVVLLLKIIPGVQARFYGFALAMPATLVVAAIATHHLPGYLRRRSGCAVTAKEVAATLVLLLVALQVEMPKISY